MSFDIPPVVHDLARLAALDSYAILDTPAEPGFDDIVQLACQLCATPVALVSLVAGDRQWFKARTGFPGCQTDLSRSVCAHALVQPNQLLIIPDLTMDPRTAGNPLVTGDPFIRFYAGAPLVTPDGVAIGSLCVIDGVPRPGGLNAAQADNLRALARQVMTQLELRKAVVVRDTRRAEETQAFRAREALRDTQAAVAMVDDDLEAVLNAVVEGAMRAVPAAEGGVVELFDGDELEYRAVAGTLLPYKGLRVPLPGTLAGHCALTRTAILVDDEMADPRLSNEVIRRVGQSAALFAPVTRGGTVLGVVKLQSSRPAAFTQADLEQLTLFAGVGTNGLNAAEARAETRAKDVYWRGLFDRLSEGFVVGEVVRDAAGHAVDLRYIEVNPAWGTLLGFDPASVTGRTVREVFPAIEEEWVDEAVRVVETGEPISFTRRLATVQRWYEGRTFKLEGDRFGTIFLEVTARVESDKRRVALLQLVDRMRDLTTIPAMTHAAAEIVGRTLGATRAGFGLIVDDMEHIDLETDWTAPGVASIVGRHRFEDYGDIRTHLQRGEALIIDDVNTDPRTREDPSAMLGLGIAALINMPVRERGRTVAVFIVHNTAPRCWSADEVSFLRNVADRVEAGVARVRAEDLQMVLNRELAHRLKNTLAVVQSIGRQTLRGVTETEKVEAFDRRLLALSRAHDILLQKSWSAAKMRTVMEGVLIMQADLDRFAFDGPDLDISPEAALSLSLLLHELATNALKYGALSADGGKVRISWRTESDATPALVLGWQESGGPQIAAPIGRPGFGSTLIRMGLLGSRKANLDYGPQGLRAEFRAPLETFQVQIH